MEITFREVGTVTVAEITGSVDGLSSAALLAALGGEVRKGRVRLVADFAGVDYISSAGLRALLGTVKDARGQGGDFRLASVSPQVGKVLDLSGFTSILKVFPDAAAAVHSFGS